MESKKIILCSLCILSGMILYAFQKQYFFIISSSSKSSSQPALTKKNAPLVPLYFFSKGTWKTETVTLVYSEHATDSLSQLINHWITLSVDEGIITKTIALQDVALSQNETEAFISFTTSPFLSHDSIMAKIMIIESLLKTLHALQPSLAQIFLFVNHKPLVDRHLDFTQPLPINGFAHE